MNSVERVKAAIHFSNPDKVPIINYGKANSDVFPLLTMPSKDWKPGHAEDEKGLFPYGEIFEWDKPEWAKDTKYDNWKKLKHEEIDEWGCIWNRTGSGATMGHPGRPSLPDWSMLDEYLERYTPNAEEKSRYSTFAKMSESVVGKKYLMAILGPHAPFSVAMNMRGFTNFLMDHRRNPDKVKFLLEHITEYFTKNMKMWVKYGGNPDGFFIYDDLGTQDRSLINPKLFEKFYEPVYRTLYETAHDLKCEFHHHCCGKIDQILPFLIEWGLDAIEFDSPRMTGYPDLKQFRGKIMMWGCVNIQSIYSQGTPEECEREVWHMVRNLGTPEGGYGAYFYPQVDQINVSKKNMTAFKKGLRKYGNYLNIPHHWWTHPISKEWKDDIVPPLPPQIP
ncbi:MAG: uroporphyrinogen decarboxylase family protein [Promethearchaeota archaeon]